MRIHATKTKTDVLQNVTKKPLRIHSIACVLSKRKSQSVAFNLKNPDGFQGEISSKTAYYFFGPRGTYIAEVNRRLFIDVVGI